MSRPMSRLKINRLERCLDRPTRGTVETEMSLHFPFDHRMLSSQDRRAPADPALRLWPTATVSKPGLGLGVARAGRSWPNANAPAGPSVAAEHSPRCQTVVSKAEQAKQPVVAKRLPGPLVAAHNNALESLAPPVHAADPRWWSDSEVGSTLRYSRTNHGPYQIAYPCCTQGRCRKCRLCRCSLGKAGDG